MRFDYSQKVYFYSAMKHENGVNDMIGCLQVVRIYNFMKEKTYMLASYIVFLFVKSKNNISNFIKVMIVVMEW